MKYALVLIVTMTSVQVYAKIGRKPKLPNSRPKVIYGLDDRHEVIDYSDPKVALLARSTAVLVKGSELKSKEAGFQVSLDTFQKGMNVCASERFSQQPDPGFCSGFLIAPNKMVTAGHCITSVEDCSETKFIFDFQMKDESNAQTYFTAPQIYSCLKILGRTFEKTGVDFAIIELDRPVDGRTPLKLSTNKNLRPSDPLIVIGNPSGLPTKITDNGIVREINDSGYMRANLDTYGGNSGSAVFNARTLEVEGILVRGDTDFVTDPFLKCAVSNVNDENGGRGEDSTLISRIVENGFTPDPPEPSEYFWLTSDNTCNEFQGGHFIREVDPALCGHGTTTGGGSNEEPGTNVRYSYFESNNTCNEFHGGDYIREVSMDHCADALPLHYTWFENDKTCNEFRGTNYIREVAASYCEH
ncbi:MAG: trypsin-like serine peptidase [Bacteriovoracaceae bacterium]